jgi:hypothetical protein
VLTGDDETVCRSHSGQCRSDGQGWGQMRSAQAAAPQDTDQRKQ